MDKMITIRKEILADLQQVMPLTTGVVIVPINRFVMIEVTEEGAYLSTGNGPCYRRVPTEFIESETPIRFCVECDKLFSTVNLYGDITCNVLHKKDKIYKDKVLAYRMEITSAKGKATLPMEDASVFNVAPDQGQYSKAFTVSSHLFRRGIINAKKFVLPGDYGRALECISVRCTKDRILVGGTDQGSIYLTAISAQIEDQVEFLISDLVYGKIISMLPDTDQQVDLHLSGKGGIFFFSEDDWISFAFADGAAPDIAGLVKRMKTDITITAETKPLRDTLKYLSDLIQLDGKHPITGDRPVHKVKITINRHGMKLQESDQFNEYTGDISLEAKVDGVEEELVIMVNGDRLRQGISCFGEVVTIELNSAMDQDGKPILVKDRDKDPEFRDVFVIGQISERY